MNSLKNYIENSIKTVMNLSTIILLVILIICNSSVHFINCLPHPTSTELDMSFRRLESGENSDEMTNQCCVRESKFQTVGYGLESDELRVDVGYCRQTCETTKVKPLKREEFDKFLKLYPDMDPIQIFLSLQHQQNNNNIVKNGVNGGNGNGGDRILFPINFNSRNDSSQQIFKLTSKSSTTSCIASTCGPTMLRRENHFTFSGGIQRNTVDIIEACDCLIPPTHCTRTSMLMTIHPATPYEKVVDIGQCSGPCSGQSDHLSTCRSIRNSSISVDGPNGQQCISTIRECQCVGECFRTREFHKVYDYTVILDESTGAGNSNSSNRAANNSTSTSDEDIGSNEVVVQLLTEPVNKTIDIGRCGGEGGGTCLNTQVASKCLIWSENNSTCLSSLYGGQNQCIPTRFMTHFYTDKVGHRHSIFSVLSCGCR